MNTVRHTPRVMLLIDADNVTADVIEQAVQQTMERHGAAHVRRAYCTAELALKQLKLFKTHSIRPIVNVSTGKNSTDIALAVDAMDLVVAERPDVVVIVSSDSDFAPLVIRLREKGCRVEGIGQEGKTGEDSKPVYDDFIDLPHRKAKAAPARAASSRAAPAKRSPRGSARALAAEPPALLDVPEPAAKAAVSAPRVAAPAAPLVPVNRAAAAAAVDAQAEAPPARKRAAKRPARAAAEAAGKAVSPPRPATGRRSSSSPPALAAERAPAPVPLPASRPKPLPDEVERILVALPELKDGSRLQLNLAKERLCNAGLLAKSAPSTKLFRKHPTLFTLTPEAAPNKVQFLRPLLQ